MEWNDLRTLLRKDILLQMVTTMAKWAQRDQMILHS